MTIESSKLRPALNWGDALLFINEQSKNISELEKQIVESNGKAIEALEDIQRFHKDGFELKDLEKKYGFLGWTCCGQLQKIAENVLKEIKSK